MNSSLFRQEIRKYALSFARSRKLQVDETHASAIIFSCLSDCFHPESLKSIRRNLDWDSRTGKKHSKVKGALEMQSSNSSDALLMNIFCHPAISRCAKVKMMFGSDMETIDFGVDGQVKIKNGGVDKTEIDMVLPGVFCEAKLTENDFTKKRREVVERYDGLFDTFHAEALPKIKTDYDNYQIIRTLLAAKQCNCDHILLCDERRPDLVRRYMSTVACLKSVEDRARCRFIFWQEIVATCDKSLRRWIEAKYGIQ